MKTSYGSMLGHVPSFQSTMQIVQTVVYGVMEREFEQQMILHGHIKGLKCIKQNLSKKGGYFR